MRRPGSGRHRRWLTAGLTLALAASGLAFTTADTGLGSDPIGTVAAPALGVTDTVDIPGGVPVAGSVQNVYRAITRTDFDAAVAADGAAPSTTDIPVPEGSEPLTLQATRVGREAAEPTLGVTSDGTAFFAAGTFDGAAVVAPRTEVKRSTDGGLTWETVTPALPDRLKSEPPVTLDPMVYVDEATDRVFNLELYVGCSYLLFSDDNADSWNRAPAACGDYVNDHQTIIAGAIPPDAAVPVSTYQDRWVYYCFNRVIDANCGRSIDGGQTWSPTATPAYVGFDPDNGGLCGGLHGHIATDPEGRLFVPKGHCNKPFVSMSSDGGDTWTRTQVSDISAASTHLSVAADAAGNVYFLWWDATYRRPWLSVSTDHGATWGEPLMISPPGVTEVNFPVLVAGDEGRLAINFPGTTSTDPTDTTRPWNEYVVVVTDAHTADPVFYSATANDPATDVFHRGDCNGRCAGLWDFVDVVIAPGTGEAWAAAADACIRNCDEKPASDKQVGDGVAIRQIGGPRLLTPTTE